MPASALQSDLFAHPALPEGFRYQDEVISREEEQKFVENFSALPFQPFQFHGFLGNRRTVSFGWRYDYSAQAIRKSADVLPFLAELKIVAGSFAKISPDAFEQILVTEYAPGAGIGWHRDKPQFDEVVAFSFLSACPLRFRRAVASGWERKTHVVQPRSAYILSGPARSQWEHSIAPLASLRYSVTMRTMAAPGHAPK